MMCKRFVCSGLLLMALSGCAALDEVVSAPDVSLRDVEVAELDFGGQTFLLAFDVSNPNPFPLPVSMISYGVHLDGHRFASGESVCEITVPAASDAEVTISVDLDLLKTAPELLFIVKEGAHRDIPYALEGRLGVDIPYAKPVRFQTSGVIRMH